MGRKGLLSLACAAVLTVACNGNARTDVATNDDTGETVGTSGDLRDDDAFEGVARGDQNFVEDLSYAGMAEIELGRLATQRGTHAEVKRYGQMMIDDHTKAGDELKQIAAQFSIQQPAGLNEGHRDLRDRLAKLSGAEFDREYMDAMVDSHQDVVDKLQSRVDEKDRSAVFTGQAERNTNVKPEDADNQVEASLNMWAATTLPVTKAHLDRAKAIQETLNDTNRRRDTD
jgi:putative membrane protein